MTREETIWWVNHLFEIRKEEYFNKGMMKDAKEVEEAQTMVLEALSADAISRKDTVTLNSPISIQADMVSVVRCKDCIYKRLYDVMTRVKPNITTV